MPAQSRPSPRRTTALPIPSSQRAPCERRLAKNCKAAWFELRRDLRKAGWKGCLAWFGFCTYLLGLPTLLVSLLFLEAIHRGLNSSCMPDGSFVFDTQGTYNDPYLLKYANFNYWVFRDFFQITLGFGALSFSEAKIIDVSWDILVGRGGQVLLAWFAWPVFARYVSLCMEVSSITFQSFITIFIHQGTNVVSMYKLLRDFVKRSLPSKMAMVLIFSTLVFLLFFPTLASAMTGYNSNVAAYVMDLNHSYVPLDGYLPAVYVIHDGWRINKSTNYYVVFEGYPESDVTYTCSPADDDTSITNSSKCSIRAAVENYLDYYDYKRGRNTSASTIFNSTPIPAPPLDIETFITEYYEPLQWVYGNNTYNKTYLQQHGSCQPTNDYKWGFSFLQLYFTILTLWILSSGVWILHLVTGFEIRRRKNPPLRVGEYKAVLKLAEDLSHEFSQLGEDPATLHETGIRRRIGKKLRGGAMTYHAPLVEELQTGSSWRQEKWWMGGTLAAMLLGFLLNVMVPMYYGRQYFVIWIAPVVGCVLATSIGTTLGSRVLIVLFCTIVLVPIIVIPLVPWFTENLN